MELGDTDLYLIANVDRPIAKIASQTLINAETETSAVLALQLKLVDLNSEEPRQGAIRTIEAIKSRHPALESIWGTGIGLRLQRIDSDICAEVQQIMRERGFPVLSVHDSFIVEQQASGVLQEDMDDVLRRAKSRLNTSGW